MHDFYPRTLFSKHRGTLVKVIERVDRKSFFFSGNNTCQYSHLFPRKSFEGLSSMCLPWPELTSCQKMFYILGEIAIHTMSQVRTYTLKTLAIKLMTNI